MLVSHYSRFPCRGITFIRTQWNKTELPFGPSGPQLPRSYGSLSSPPTHLPLCRPRYNHTKSQPNGRIPKDLNRNIHTEAATSPRKPQSTPHSSIGNPTPERDGHIRSRIRTLMRRVPHPVAIITSSDPKSPSETAFRGMTVSSFNTVTLYPEPIVSFNVKVPSETLNAIRTSSQFLVHLLSPNESTARLARLFSGGNENLPLEGDERFFAFSSPEFPDKQPRLETGEPPVLSLKPNSSSNGVGSNTIDFPFIFRCEYLPQSVSVGDHMIVLGKVAKILAHPELSISRVKNTGLCLTYADTKFWKMGEEIPSPVKPSRTAEDGKE